MYNLDYSFVITVLCGGKGCDNTTIIKEFMLPTGGIFAWYYVEKVLILA